MKRKVPIPYEINNENKIIIIMLFIYLILLGYKCTANNGQDYLFRNKYL